MDAMVKMDAMIKQRVAVKQKAPVIESIIKPIDLPIIKILKPPAPIIMPLRVNLGRKRRKKFKTKNRLFYGEYHNPVASGLVLLGIKNKKKKPKRRKKTKTKKSNDKRSKKWEVTLPKSLF